MKSWASSFICLLLLGCGALPSTRGIELHTAGVRELQAEMSAGRLTSRELTKHFLARIEAVDRNGPKLNSVIEVNPDALAIAERLDAERRAGHVRGPLHGIPILIKDNIDTADRMATTAGSLALVNVPPPAADAFVVQRLREAGAVLLGKTNLSEWANFRSERSSSGWSARGGQTRNFHAVERSPCGSSSGSGVAVAAGLAVAAIGTETDGSIVCPASVNGVVGVKPTVGLVSRSGIIPIAVSQDTAGPMTRSAEDAAILLDAMHGEDPLDAATAALRAREVPRFAEGLRSDALRGARIGVARTLAGFHEGVDVIFEEALARMKAAGAVLVDPANLELPKTLRDDEVTVLLYEFKDGVNRYLATRVDAPRTLADLIAFNERETAREMPYFRQETFLKAQAKGSLEEAEYREARERGRLAAGRDGIDALLVRHQLDAIVAPTRGPAWTLDLVNGDHGKSGGVSRPPAVAGYPHITVPMGFLHGLPIGVSFVGSAWSERRLLELAHAFERSR